MPAMRPRQNRGLAESETVERHELTFGVGSRLGTGTGGLDVGRSTGGTGRPWWLIGTRNDNPHVCRFVALGVETKENWPDSHFVARMKPRLVDQSPIDTHAIPASQVADQYAVVGHGQAAVPARDFRRFNTNITIKMAADQDNRPMQGHHRGGRRNQGDESE